MQTTDFRTLRISLASPEQIRSWSYGEVTKPETINYRRLRPEKDGLFCEAIFGPTRDWQCYCGKYKNVRYKGIICDKCGVEVTRSAVRRERLGHLELAAPVAHVWYTRRVPSHLGLLLNVSRRNLDRVLYFAQYVTTHVDEEARNRALKRIDEELAEAEMGLEEEIQGGVVAETVEVNERISSIQVDLDGVNDEAEELLAAVTDQIVQEAKLIETRMEGISKGIATEDVYLGDVLIISKGEKWGKEHLVVLQDETNSRLTKAQADSETMRQERFAQLQRELDELRIEEGRVAQTFRDQSGSNLTRLRQQAQLSRDQLESLSYMGFLNENEYREYKSKFGNVFRAGMGAEAFYEILANMDLDKLSKELWRAVRTSRSKQSAKRATKRLHVVEALRKSKNRPEWMILTVLPVIPPDLRPMVQLDGGRFATSDLNDLYRRVINRNNRLKRLLDLGAPDVIVRNEKRMLQEAVDSLIDNSQRGKALSRRGRRELKSLSDMLKGKKGRFRRNLLGKRVDYSGRSVIVVGPTLKMGECGLPKVMALELFRPFVISKLVHYGHASNIKGAKRIIERQTPEVWEALEEVIKGRPILLNRAPTLHRLGIQAFMPQLIEGKAIQLHPLVCAAFNADFDGDQMAVHVPLSDRAREEAITLMLSTRNLLKPSDGQPVVGPAKDMVMGVYYLTVMLPDRKGEGKYFSSPSEVETAFELEHVHIHAKIKLIVDTYYDEQGARYEDNKPRRRLVETSPGRVIFNQYLPEKVRFVNKTLDKGKVNALVDDVYHVAGEEATIQTVDNIKDIGFRYATRSGTTIAISDLIVPTERTEILDFARGHVDEIDKQFRRGLLTEDEQYRKTIEQWTEAKNKVEKAVREAMDPAGPVTMMALSGSTKGGFGPITQLAGMRGLMADPQGRIIPVPITSNFRQGLTTLEYFISTHGARKGLADTALRTADAGYLTRRLVDVAQDVIVMSDDCGTQNGITIKRSDSFSDKDPLSERIYGRFAALPILHPKTGEVLVDAGVMFNRDSAKVVDVHQLDNIFVFSPMTCEMKRGICTKCYGADLSSGKPVAMGTAVGIVAAQSIGEPGTQLTLRTFHTGGTAQASGDITQGLPRVEELFEARQRPKGEAVISEIGGICELSVIDGVRHVLVTDQILVEDRYDVPAGWEMMIEHGQSVEEGQLIAQSGSELLAVRNSGTVQLDENGLKILWSSVEERDNEIPAGVRLLVDTGHRIDAGQQLTEGSKNPHRILEILGRDAVTQYLLLEVQEVYRSQGQNINDKHFEVIIRKMLDKVSITASGDTEMLPGDLVENLKYQRANDEIIEEGGQPAQAEPVLLGITKASLNTDSFLSASSFQHTIKVLAGAAIAGKEDALLGLKENVIIGKLIPAGTGFNLDHYNLPDPSLAEEQDYEEDYSYDEDFSTGDEDLDILEALMAAQADAAQLDTDVNFDDEE